MKLNTNKLTLAMANARLNAYGLCEAAGIQYATYNRIVNESLVNLLQRAISQRH